MQPNWQKCVGNVWGTLLEVNLNHFHFNNMEGVYIIWQGNGPVVRVGQGNIRNRLYHHRNDPKIIKYPSLYVTWAPVHALYRDSVERYLANILKPVVGDAFPNVVPTPVVLPWPWRM